MEILIVLGLVFVWVLLRVRRESSSSTKSSEEPSLRASVAEPLPTIEPPAQPLVMNPEVVQEQPKCRRPSSSGRRLMVSYEILSLPVSLRPPR